MNREFTLTGNQKLKNICMILRLKLKLSTLYYKFLKHKHYNNIDAT